MSNTNEVYFVQVKKTTVIEAGSCSFCIGNKHHKVYVLIGAGVISRICEKCLKILKSEAK